MRTQVRILFLFLSLSVVVNGLLLETLARTSLSDMERIARNDMAVIAKNEDQLDKHVQEFFRLTYKIDQALFNNKNNNNPEVKATKPESFAARQKAKREKIQQGLAKMKEMNQELEDNFHKHSQFLNSGIVGQIIGAKGAKQKIADVMGPALMIPMLETMYAKFKSDIKRANQQENRAKQRVVKQEKEYIQFQKDGKTYLLKDKQRVVDYYKTQREIQHRHYHAMLKMAHSMMERIKNVKGMCQKAKNGEKLNKKEIMELGSMAGAAEH